MNFVFSFFLRKRHFNDVTITSSLRTVVEVDLLMGLFTIFQSPGMSG